MGLSGPEQLRTTVTTGEGGVVDITVVGEVDLATVGEFREQVGPASLADRTVVFHLGDVSFMDSSGLAVLLEVAQSAASVVLDAPSPIVRRLVEATGVGTRFEVRP
jgi:anti-anti-sigma factor